MGLREGSGFDDEGGVFLASSNRVVFDVEVLNHLGLVLDKAQRIEFIGMTNIDAAVKLVKETQGSSVKVGDDLDHNASDGSGVHRFQSVWTSTEMKDAELTEQENQTLLGFVGHLLESVVDVRPLFEDSEARVVDISALFLVGCIGLCNPFG